MTSDEKMRAYRPRREHVKLIVAKEGWAVYLSPAAKIVDLAIVMSALRVPTRPLACEVALGFLVRPFDRYAPAPTAAEFEAIFERGFDAGAALPGFLCRQAS